MQWFAESWRRVAHFLNRSRFDHDLAEEMRLHVDLRAERNTAAGMSPERARLEARRQFGNATLLRERSREAWNWYWLQTVGQDLRYGLRTLAADRAFTLAALVSLIIGIGANTAVFSLLNAVMMRTLPVEDPRALVQVAEKKNTYFTNPIWEEIRDRKELFAGSAAFSETKWNLAGSGEAQYARGLWVSGDFFRVLGVAPLRGRMISVADDKPGCGNSGPVGVVSYAFWKGRLGSDPNVIGSTVRLDRHPFQVIGVAPPWFTGLDLDQGFDVAIPIGCEPIINTDRSALKERSWWWLRIIARLKPGQTVQQATAQIGAASPGIYRATVPERWDPKGQSEYVRRSLAVESAATGFSSTGTRYRTALFTLMAAVALVLLIACANVANLLVARAATRQRELSVRLAIGASRARVARQLLTESVLLAVLGAAGGALFAFWGSGLLVRLLSTARDQLDLNVSPDGRVLAFTAATAVITGLLFGIAPAWRGAASGVGSALKESGRGGISGGSKFRLGKLLVAVQVGLSLVLLTGAAVFSGSLRNLLAQDAGFDRRNVLLVHAAVPPAQVPYAQRNDIFLNMLEGIRRMPAVRSASASMLTPVSNMVWNEDVYPEGYTSKGQEDTLMYFNRVSRGYFQTMGTRFIAGRDFTDRDDATAPKVIIISRSAARKFWGDANPIGKIIRIDTPDRPGNKVEHQVVGVVADTKYVQLDEAPRMTGYCPFAQEPEPSSSTTIEIRSDAKPETLIPDLRSIASGAHKDMSIEFGSLDRQVKDSLIQARLLALISGFFGFFALMLAATGLYGVIAYITARRRSEIGIRVALGAEFGSVVWLVLRDAGIMLGVGILAGLAASVAAGRLVQTLVYGIKASDPAVLATATAALVLAAAVAAWLPARRAARMDPMSALRDD